MDSNHRPLPCQGSALTRLSYGPARQTVAFSILMAAGDSGNVGSRGKFEITGGEFLALSLDHEAARESVAESHGS